MDRASRYVGILLGALIVVILINFALAFTIGIGVVPYQALDLTTPLMKSAELGLVEDVRQLIQAGATVNKQQGQSWHLGVILIVVGPELGGRRGRTALMYAAESRSIETVRALLDAGADINLKDSMGDDALKHATFNGPSAESLAIIELLTCMKDHQSTDHPCDTATPAS